MIDVVVSYMLGGEQRESTITFGNATNEIITGKDKGPVAKELADLYDRRSKEEWYEYFYNCAVLLCWNVWFEWGFIPRDLSPKRFIPTISIISATFPGGWVLYKEAKLSGPHPIYTVKEYLDTIQNDMNEISDKNSSP